MNQRMNITPENETGMETEDTVRVKVLEMNKTGTIRLRTTT